MRVISIVGARPQFVKLGPVSIALDNAAIEHFVVHTGQHYDADMSDVFFDGLNLRAPDWNLEVGSATHGIQTAAIMQALEPILTDTQPEWLVVYGDTNSTLAGALVAAKLGVRLAHVEAGLRSHNRAMPEEINRVLTDHASDGLFAPTARAVSNLDREGLKGRTLLVGDVMADLLLGLGSTGTLDQETTLVTVAEEPYVVATIHRAGNTDDPRRLELLVSRLAAMRMPVVLVAHPRLRAAASRYNVPLGQGAIQVVAPLPYVEMLRLVKRSAGLITDSGGLQKEAFLLGVPCSTLRAETEWPETLQGYMNMLDPDAEHVDALATRLVDSPSTNPYGSGDAAQRMVDALVQWPG